MSEPSKKEQTDVDPTATSSKQLATEALDALRVIEMKSSALRKTYRGMCLEIDRKEQGLKAKRRHTQSECDKKKNETNRDIEEQLKQAKQEAERLVSAAKREAHNIGFQANSDATRAKREAETYASKLRKDTDSDMALLRKTETEKWRNTHQKLELEKKEWRDEMELASAKLTFGEVISLSVGGRRFDLAKKCLTTGRAEGSFFAIMFSGRHQLACTSDGLYLIQRDGDLFSFIYLYLVESTPKPIPTLDIRKALVAEADYFQLEDFKDELMYEWIDVPPPAREKQNDRYYRHEPLPGIVSRQGNQFQYHIDNTKHDVVVRGLVVSAYAYGNTSRADVAVTYKTESFRCVIMTESNQYVHSITFERPISMSVGDTLRLTLSDAVRQNMQFNGVSAYGQWRKRLLD